MKRLLCICLLMLALSFPALGGHTNQGDSYCTCGTPGCIEDYPGECGGKMLSASTSTETPDSGTAEWGIVLVALLLWLRLKA